MLDGIPRSLGIDEIPSEHVRPCPEGRTQGCLHPMRPHHRELYAYLSHQSHQDFVAGENFLNVLNSGADPESMQYPGIEGDMRAILQIADRSAACIVM